MKPHDRIHDTAASGAPLLPTVRPLPYFGAYPHYGERELAASLRRDFRPLLARRLPDHHLVGQRHGSVPAFVARYKKAFPYFVRTDIARFYPSVRHQDLVVGAQLAWRDLLGLSYVPSKFKRRYVGPLMSWCESLPLERGIPLGSALSGVAAPLMLVPLWLELRRRFNVPLTVYMDDVLVCCRDREEGAEVYAYLVRRLGEDFDLTPQYGKTCSGRFADTPLTFCGWRFAGGYAGVDPKKAEAFRARVDAVCRRGARSSVRGLVKRLNATVTAFGHYYKYGSVRRQFAGLDVYIRRRLRESLGAGTGATDNASLRRLGFRSLSDICAGTAQRRTARHPVPERAGSRAGVRTVPLEQAAQTEELTALLHAVSDKLTELVRGQRKLLRLLEPLQGGY